MCTLAYSAAPSLVDPGYITAVFKNRRDTVYIIESRYLVCTLDLDMYGRKRDKVTLTRAQRTRRSLAGGGPRPSSELKCPLMMMRMCSVCVCVCACEEIE